MDWDALWSVVNQNLGTILTAIFSLILSVISFLITFIKTRSKSLEGKINKQLVSKNFSLDLSKYYTTINGKEYCLKDLEFTKKGD